MLRLLPPDSNEHVFHDPDDGVFEIQSHFLLLHIKSDIEDMLNKTPASLDPRRHHELEVFANMYTKESALADAWKKYSDLTRRKMIDWKNLKGLFRKGQLVVHRVLPNDWAVSKVTSVGSSTRSSDSELVVRLESIDNDGKGFRYVWSDRTFKPFPNERRISELNVFPLDYHDDRESLEKMAIASGKRWKRLYEDMFNKASRTIQIQVMEYDGYATRKEDKGPMTHVSSRVVVDPRIQAKRTDLSFIQDSRIPFVTENKDTEEPTNEQYLLCPATVLVHALSDNELYHVPTKRLREANWCRDGWSRLVIDEDIKHQANHLLQLSRAREIQHAKGEDNGSYISGGQGHDEDQSIDNFRGKGRGLIFLLHGPPGVGKTLLAECLSEEQRRPLYRVSLSNLTNYDERRIDKLFREAHMWNAILLIDEAEVILAERTMENMKQSAWVAVFLRKIEYFEGILFLTTNQIHFIDQAFESRVTVGIRFPKMDRDQRVKVWQKLLEPPAKKLWGSDALITTKERLGRWADRELNGRHIHNVINSAQILTRGGDPRKPSELIENCLDAVTGFMNMIKQEKEDERKSYLSNWY
ncbi:P-loop containing nucleoside triphosphate hydrolase protein [Echria macrotheca]|uniref:P-loop containing nucleoside triphosphate hydrolase protein n=1 Tax=Echria macrotheca TaxID=438768 RepID=A0AAJ0BAU9_9PEZI|nr:P-loop containing nucleoside triphosphate hydrolase protein [Echria macrotheca]